MPLNSVVKVISPQGELTPYGPVPSYRSFRVAGIFESGFYDFDAGLAYTTLVAAQDALSLQDVVNQIELQLDDLNLAPQVAEAADGIAGPNFASVTWMEQNRQLFHALRMEKMVTIVTIGLIVLVAALNILIALVMMVMEKYRDIAVLISIGAKRQIRSIFMLQGADHRRGRQRRRGLGRRATRSATSPKTTAGCGSTKVYALSYVPFEPRVLDGVWIAAAAILVSFLATIYPARSATKIAPAEVLRYE